MYGIPRYLATSLLAALPACALADPSARVEGGQAIVTSDGYKAAINLSDARITLDMPAHPYHLKTSIILDGAWVEPTTAAKAPAIHTTAGSATVEVTYPVAGNREFTVDVSAYKNAPGIYIVSRLKNLGQLHSDYYFWSWEGGYASYQVPADSVSHAGAPSHPGEIVTIKADPATYGRFGAFDWVYLPEEQGGLAVFTKQTLGRGPDSDRMTFLNAIPNNQMVDRGGSMDMGMGLVSVKDPQEAARVYDAVRKQSIPALNVTVKNQAFRDVDYGKPAPKWARNIDKYNCWPFVSCAPSQWTDADLKEWFGDFPLMSHVPNDPALIRRCHKAGLHVVMYINFMEMLNSEVQKAIGAKGAGYLNDNWGKIVDHENMDLAKHPNWVAYDKDGKARQSVWGAQTNVPGLYNTCLQQLDLHDAAIEQLKKVMALGVDGIFIDNAGPIQECYGDKFGKHTHAMPGKTNTEMYEMLMKRVYKVVKSYGNDKIVVINSGITPGQWSYSDVQMWESCLYGSGVVTPTTQWEDAKYMGELQQDALRHGKTPVIMSYFFDQPVAVRSDRALFTYAYARLYGMGWCDWFSMMGNDCDKKASRDLYSAQLGKAAGKVVPVNRVYYRLFDQGIAVVNPEKTERTITIDTPRDGALRDVCFDDTLSSAGGKVTLTLRPQSGRVLLWK